jgi:HAD superfamily hydrolase (TIGR01450 family)
MEAGKVEGTLATGRRALHEDYDVALLDLDGVVYVGRKPVPGAPQALQRANAAGLHLAYVTNNASRTPAAVAEVLGGMGVPAAEGDVVTSPQAAARLLADKLPAGAKVLVIGSTALRLAVRERGLIPVSTAAGNPQAVVQGYLPGIDYHALAEGGLAVRAGALFVGTNADSTIPSARGIQPGNGSLLRVIAYATGTEPVIAGKPELPLHRESIIRTGATRPLVVGDRLDTDIEAASRAGTDSLLVLTGVSRPADLVTASPEHRPAFIALSLDALLEPYPDVISEDDTDVAAPAPAVAADGPAAPQRAFTCQGWTAAWTGGTVSLTAPGRGPGAGSPVDGLRALCAAAWSRPPAPPEAFAAALARLTEAGLPT